jgi:hypothetical protein
MVQGTRSEDNIFAQGTMLGRSSWSGEQLKSVNPVVAEEAGDTPKHT